MGYYLAMSRGLGKGSNTYLILVLMLIISAPAILLARIRLGIEILAKEHPEMVRDKKLALLVSRSSIDQELNHSIDRLNKAAHIKLIFTADRYFREIIPGDEAGLQRDAITNARVIEISDPLKRPSSSLLSECDILVIDIQDIGVRYFNYLTLLAQFLDVAREAQIPVIILDRPNPINASTVAGPVLEVSFRSRFGVYPVPLIYGMTVGELALYFNKVFGLGANLTVIGMEGYMRSIAFKDTGLHWVPPSDHIPEPETPIFYATTGFLGELGVFSTGVGTTRPFRYVLAPWIDGELLAQKLELHKISGVRFIHTNQKPYYGLFSGQNIGGIEIVITDRVSYDPFLAGIAILRVMWQLYPSRVPLNNPAAAEAIDTLLGNSKVRLGIINGLPLMQIYASLQPELKEFMRRRREFMIYPE